MPNDKPIADKGSETLETVDERRDFETAFIHAHDMNVLEAARAIHRESNGEYASGPTWHEYAGWKLGRATVAREMIAELRNEADRREAHWRGEIPTYDHGRIRGLRDAAENFESSPRYGAGSSKVKPGEPTQ